ncbi:MAG: lysine-2,3-aminomutase-like protein [Hyphomicrobium sp.]
MFKRSFHSPTDLIKVGFIQEEDEADLFNVSEKYPLSLTPTVLKLISSRDENDPIGRQFIPSKDELLDHDNERSDPIGDHLKSPVHGLVHRHADRVLLKIVGVCPVYCRFCFRRDMIGPEKGTNLTDEQIEKALEYIEAHPQIWEVILTGGDPFMLSERRIGDLVGKIEKISHVKILRWHTRVPFVDPHKITTSFVDRLKNTSKTVIVALHVNHPKEFSEEALIAVRELRNAGIALVSQTVLLRGVNDNVDTMEELLRAFLKAGILPYYIHHPDLARGTKHFRISIMQGLDIMRALQERLSKIARPDYVIDLPDAFEKISLLSSKVRHFEETYLIEDSQGRVHTYRDAI